MSDIWIQRYSDTVTDTAELQNTEFIEHMSCLLSTLICFSTYLPSEKNACRIDQYIVLGIYSIRNLLCACMKNSEPPKSETLGHVLLTIN